MVMAGGISSALISGYSTCLRLRSEGRSCFDDVGGGGFEVSEELDGGRRDSRNGEESRAGRERDGRAVRGRGGRPARHARWRVHSAHF